MNETHRQWAPYPIVTCIIGKQALVGLNIPLCIISCICNTLVLYVLMYRANITDRLILSLTTADLLTSFISQPMLIIVYIFDMLSNDSETLFLLQRVAAVLNGTTCAASVMSIGFIVFARYIQITRPLRYHLLIDKRRTVAICVFIWTCAFITSLPTWIPGIDMRVYFAIIVSCIVIEAMAIGFINIKIIFIARRIVRSSDQPAPPSKKAFKTIIIISAVYIMSILPFSVIGTVYAFKWPAMMQTPRPNFLCGEAQRNVCASMYFYFILLYHTTSMSNPVVYTLRDVRIKFALKRLLMEKFPAVSSYLGRRHSNQDSQLRIINTMVSNSPVPLRSRSVVSAIESRVSVCVLLLPQTVERC